TAWVTRAMIECNSLFSRASAWFSLTSSLTCESSVAGVPVPAAASWALVRRRLLVVLGDIGLFPPRLTGGPPPRTVYADCRWLIDMVPRRHRPPGTNQLRRTGISCA